MARDALDDCFASRQTVAEELRGATRHNIGKLNCWVIARIDEGDRFVEVLEQPTTQC